MMAYDTQSDRMILFGGLGYPLSRLSDTWAYDFNTNTWTNMTRPGGPSGLFGSMAYDSQSDRVILILFGGETWAYDFETNTWTNMDPATRPPAGPYQVQAMAYDSQSDRVILFGGETWAYDFETNTWTNMTPQVGPYSPVESAMAYDSQSDRVILFRGDPDFGPPYTGETWAYDFNTNTWTNMTRPGGPSHMGSRMAYDSQSDRAILFGTLDPFNSRGNTWAYDFETNTWTNVNQVGDPGGRSSHAMAYDSQSDRVVLFGGWLHDFLFNDTWAYDFEASIWVELTPRPIGRPSKLMAYDSESDRIIVVAGDAFSPYFRTNSDTWAYDYESDTWLKMNSVGPDTGFPLTWSVTGRPTMDMAYDSESDRVIILGWVANPLGPLQAGTWAYDFNTNTWTNMTRPGGPSGLFGSRMAYDAESDRTVLFGGGTIFGECGHPDGQVRCQNETWAYDFNTNTWTNMTPQVGPPDVLGAGLAYDSQSDRIVLFGGFYPGTLGLVDGGSRGGAVHLAPSGPCSNETWAYNFNMNTWTNMTQPSGPIGRGFSAVAYDSDHDRTLLYGGGCGSFPDGSGYVGFWGIHQDTWAYDLDTNTWTNMTPSSNPGAQANHAMAYDSKSHVVVLLGGQFPQDLPVNLGPWWYRHPGSVPTSPRSLRAVEGNRQVTLTWEAPDYDAGRPIEGYRIYRFTWPEGLSIIATIGRVLTYTDTRLTNGVLYYYWVSAFNAIGDGTLSETAAATPRLTLSAPMNLHAAAGNARVVLTWQPASSGDGSRIPGYRVYRGTSLGSLFTAADVGDVLTYLDTDVTNGVTYYYRVSAIVGADEGPRSVEAIARPTESTNPTIAILSPIDGTTLTSMSVIISGSASDDTAILTVELSQDGTNWVTVTGTTSWSGRVNLDEGTNTIYARATDTSGNTATTRISVAVSNPILASLSSSIVIVVTAAGIAAILGAVVIRRRRDRRWERK